MKHKWELGQWERADKYDRYLTRKDVCVLCGCTRTSISFRRNGKTAFAVVGYNRSKIIFGSDDIPQCWGAKNPV